MISEEALKRAIDRMNGDLRAAEEKCQAGGLVHPFAGLGNKKTKCVNEATLPVITCSPACITRCARTCYVVTTASMFRKACRQRQAENTVLRRRDPEAYYEYFYRLAEKKQLPIRLSDGGDFENAEQVKACIAVARRHPAVHAILYTKRIELLPLLVDRPATLHTRYSAWEGDDEGTVRARELGFDITYVVDDGTGNCPYQKSLAKYEKRRMELEQEFLNQGLEKPVAHVRAKQQADDEIQVWHCRFCAQKGTGCCRPGDVKFNVVGAAHWEQAAQN